MGNRQSSSASKVSSKSEEPSSPSPEELLRAEQLIMLGMISAVLLCFLLSQEESTESSVSCESDKSKKDIINFKESSSPSPNLQRADCAGLNMSNMSEVTFDHCTFSISELQRAQSAGINMFNMSQVTFQHCTFSQCSGEVSSSSSVSLKSDQSEEDISNIKESSSLRMGNSQSSSASKVSSKSEEPSSPSDEDLRGDVTSDCPGV